MKKNFTFFLNFFGTANWLTKEKMKELTDAKKTKKLCKQILEAKTDEERSKLKKQLYAICWQGRWPEGAKRNNETAEPTGCVMLDLDHLDEDVRDYWHSIKVEAKKNHLLVAHITPSGTGLRLVYPIPVGMAIEEAQAYYTRKLGLKNVDTCVKDLARLSFVPERSYWLYCSDAIFTGELPEVEAEEELPEEAVTDTPEEGAVVAAQKDYPKEYRGRRETFRVIFVRLTYWLRLNVNGLISVVWVKQRKITEKIRNGMTSGWLGTWVWNELFCFPEFPKKQCTLNGFNSTILPQFGM